MTPTLQHSGSNELIYLLQQLVKPWTDFKHQKGFYIWNLLPQLKRSPSSGSREEVRIINEIRNIASQEEWENLEEILEGMYSTESSKRKTVSQVSEYLLTTSYQQDDRYLNFETSKEPLGNSDNPAITDSLLDTDMSFEIAAQVEDEPFHETCADIANILADYRAGEIPQITPSDVKAWIEQFAFQTNPEKVLFSVGIKDIFSRYYYSQEEVELGIRTFLQNRIIFGELPTIGIQSVVLIDSKQKFGNSHQELTVLTRKIIKELYNIDVRGEGESAHYIYVDDCLFSGNRIIKGLKKINESMQFHDCRIIIYCHAIHSDSIEYVNEELKKLFSHKRVNITITQSIILDNRRSTESRVECIWPKKFRSSHIDLWQAYLETTRSAKNPARKLIFCYPNRPIEERVYHSTDARKVVEHHLLIAGINILANHYSLNQPNCNKVQTGDIDNYQYCVRPLGFDKLKGLGFGSIYFSYRNVANNCPTAFWYDGALDNSSWLPLLKRKTDNPESWWR